MVVAGEAVANKFPEWTLRCEAISWTARAWLIPTKDRPASWGVADTGVGGTRGDRVGEGHHSGWCTTRS